MKQLANASGFDIRLIGQKTMPNNDPRVFYAFAVSPKVEFEVH